MMGTAALDKIHEDLEFIKKEISEIKEHMVDADTILTPEEGKELDESIERYKQGKTRDFDKIKKEPGL